MDINPLLAAEINLAWIRFALSDMSDELIEWIDKNGFEDEEFFTDIEVSMHDAVTRVRQSLGSIIGELEDVWVTSGRLFKCRQINAWEIKPCWNVYTKLKQEVSDICAEPDEFDMDQLKKQFTQLQKDVLTIKYEMYEVDDYVELSKSEKEWLIKLADDIHSMANLKKKPLYEEALLLYTVYSRALDYCNCQKNTNLVPCMKELDELHKAVEECNAFFDVEDQ